jgi:hypothetical protein
LVGQSPLPNSAIQAFPALPLLTHLSSHRNKPHGQYGVLLDDVPMLLQKVKRLITGLANWNDHPSAIA